tara:strand:- start:16185 stop:17573 length:1389 start_codon:yes stop_codon:yes gene_type:complete
MNQKTTRRNLLRGLGATLALPWMESFGASGPTRNLKLSEPPLRSAFLFFPNGVVPEHWTPADIEGEPENWQTTPMLKPLENLKQEFLLLENLWHRETVGRNGHWPKVPAWLSGGYVERGSGADLDTGGTSIDQLLARQIGHRTALPSIELGVDAASSGIDNVGGGFPRILGSHISWKDPHTPVQKEISPQQAFDRLFRSKNTFPEVPGMGPDSPAVRHSLQRDDSSILDLVLEDAKSLQRRISKHDQTKLDEYLESVRSVEQRIERAMKPQPRWVNAKQLKMARPAPDTPDDHEEHVKLMLEIMVLAFWTDTTRIGSFMFGNAQTGRQFDFIPGVRKKSFHGLSHHRNEPELKEEYEKIGTWHVSQFAYLLNRMRSLDEGGSSLLDNSQILFGSSLKDGNRHDPHDLPLIVAGGAKGQLRSGRRVRAPENTPMCNLLVSLAHNAGADLKKFGDSTGTLAGLG